MKRSNVIIAAVLVLLVVSVGAYAGYVYYSGIQSQGQLNYASL